MGCRLARSCSFAARAIHARLSGAFVARTWLTAARSAPRRCTRPAGRSSRPTIRSPSSSTGSSTTPSRSPTKVTRPCSCSAGTGGSPTRPARPTSTRVLASWASSGVRTNGAGEFQLSGALPGRYGLFLGGPVGGVIGDALCFSFRGRAAEHHGAETQY